MIERRKTESFILASYSKTQLRRHFQSVASRAAERILRIRPDVVAIAVDGSVGRSDPSPYSDVDIFALVEGGGKRPGPLYYLDDGCYVGAWFVPVKQEERNAVDFLWRRGGARSVRALYDPRGVLRRLVKKRQYEKPWIDIVEKSLLEAYTNIIEYAGKLRNGWLASDDYLTRYAARIIASRSEEIVLLLNTISPPTENVLRNLLVKAKIRPGHFRVDYSLAIGLEGTKDTGRVYQAALRLAKESLALVRTRFGGRSRSKSLKRLLDQPVHEIGL